MKKILFALACFATVSFSSNAQMKITPAIGLNMSNFSPADGGKSKMGVHLGAYVGFNLTESLSLQPGLFYSMKGAKDAADNAWDANYLEIPINAVYAFGESGFSLHAGPYLGMLMSAKYMGIDVKSAMESMDYGLNVGASYNLPANLMLRVQYGLGMAEIASGSDTKNTNIGITIGYRLGNKD